MSQPPGLEKKTISIVVDSAKGSVELEVLKTAKVQEVLSQAVSALNLGNPADWELVYQGERMKPERTLVSYGVKDEDHLELSRITVKGLGQKCD